MLLHTFQIRKGEEAAVFLLFLNFFFIIVTYYISKPVRSALVITDLGSEALPYIWVLAALFLAVFISFYNRLVGRIRRDKLIALTTSFFIISVLIIRWALHFNMPWLTGVFYLWSDIFSVVMVEQFWSFCNDFFDTNQAKRLYGIIGSGGILGGVFGSALTTELVKYVGTEDLIYVCAIILSIVILITFLVQKTSSIKQSGINLVEINHYKESVSFFDGFKLVYNNPYLRSILFFVLLTQAVSNIIDYQFNVTLEKHFDTMDEKTSFISGFYFWLNLFSFFLMFVAASKMQQFLGIFFCLLILPMADLMGLILNLVVPSATVVYGLKFFDKGLNYSISRASKEILYIPTTKEVKYKAKAVIDMFAFRFSKIISFAIILPFTTVLPLFLFDYAGVAVALFLIFIVWKLGLHYRLIEEKTGSNLPLALISIKQEKGQRQI